MSHRVVAMVIKPTNCYPATKLFSPLILPHIGDGSIPITDENAELRRLDFCSL